MPGSGKLPIGGRFLRKLWPWESTPHASKSSIGGLLWNVLAANLPMNWAKGSLIGGHDGNWRGRQSLSRRRSNCPAGGRGKGHVCDTVGESRGRGREKRANCSSGCVGRKRFL